MNVCFRAALRVVTAMISLVLVVTLLGCDSSDATAADPQQSGGAATDGEAAASSRAEPNVVKGTIRTSDGRPLPGATVRVAGNSGVGQSQTIKTTSDEQGHYRVEVPAGDYNVDAWANIEYDGQTYREIWLDRVNGGCERVLSADGIVRDFVLKLTGLKRCINNPDPGVAASYNGGYAAARSFNFPDDATITFTLVPQGPLLDGSEGQTLTLTRSGAALKRPDGEPLDQTSYLHDIPLGRYRVRATVTQPDGTQQPLDLRVDGSGLDAAREVDMTFPATKNFPYGHQSVILHLSESAG